MRGGQVIEGFKNLGVQNIDPEDSEKPLKGSRQDNMKGKESHFRVSLNDIGYSSFAREAMRSRTTTTRLEGHRAESGAVGLHPRASGSASQCPWEAELSFWPPCARGGV